jgi:hypothetical protein
MLARLNWAAAALHLIQAIVVFALTLWLNSRGGVVAGVFPLFKTVHVWVTDNNTTTMRPAMMVGDGYFIQTVVEPAGSLDVRYVIASFFALSAAFQGAAGFLGIMDPYFRFIEYAFSASAMIMAIAVEAGVDDIYTLQAMFVLTFATMIFGILADLSSPPALAWLAHAAGWVTFLSAYSPILDSFMRSSALSAAPAPGFVHVIVFLQFVLFACFGAVQCYALLYPAGPQQDNEESPTDIAYIVLSLTAKSVLAWLILSPVLLL